MFVTDGILEVETIIFKALLVSVELTLTVGGLEWSVYEIRT